MPDNFAIFNLEGCEIEESKNSVAFTTFCSPRFLLHVANVPTFLAALAFDFEAVFHLHQVRFHKLVETCENVVVVNARPQYTAHHCNTIHHLYHSILSVTEYITGLVKPFTT